MKKSVAAVVVLGFLLVVAFIDASNPQDDSDLVFDEEILSEAGTSWSSLVANSRVKREPPPSLEERGHGRHRQSVSGGNGSKLAAKGLWTGHHKTKKLHHQEDGGQMKKHRAGHDDTSTMAIKKRVSGRAQPAKKKHTKRNSKAKAIAMKIQADDEDMMLADGSGSGDGPVIPLPPPIGGATPGTRKVYRCSMLIQEPYNEELSNRFSDDFGDMSERFNTAIEQIYQTVPGAQTATVQTFERTSQLSLTKVNFDIESQDFDEEKVIKETLRSAIRNGRVGSFFVESEGFTFRPVTGPSISPIDPEDPELTEDCDVPCQSGGECVRLDQRCDGTEDCRDGSDEYGCQAPSQPGQPAEPLPEELDCRGDIKSKCRGTNNQFYCEEHQCDGIVKCPEGDDEEDCPNLVSSTTPPAPPPTAAPTTPTTTRPAPTTTTTTTTTTPEPEPEPPLPTGCPQDQFSCDGRCLPFSVFCDGRADCLDGGDESDCPVIECQSGEFKCRNNQCISNEQVCDKYADCPDKEDEENCPFGPEPCQAGEFQCKSDKTCIAIAQRCDGRDDCRDGSDEIGCLCTKNQWQCDFGSCIDGKLRCDGKVDCPTDQSDEANCLTEWTTPSNVMPTEAAPTSAPPVDESAGGGAGSSTSDCRSDEFQCDDGSCVGRHFRCDNVPDCSDASDEDNCSLTPPCSWPNPFRCGDGSCIDASTQRCNGVADCADSSDESDCAFLKECPSNEFRCTDGTCIDIRRKCDGYGDCRDRSDEINCTSCLADQFRCSSSGFCIPSNQKCDGIVDCPDRDDEVDCATPPPPVCTEYQFRCRDGTCLDSRRRCDARYDCPDESDEEDCDCRTDQFRCDSGQCIEGNRRCDRTVDCPDRSDESNCGVQCKNGEFSCASGDQCVPYSLVCDGRRDCQDFSDEAECQWTKCPEGEFSCENGPCIPMERRCDGRIDCPESSDEFDCPSRNDELNLKTYPADQTILQGREVVFQCRDEGPARAPVRWTRGSGLALPPSTRDNNGRLEMPNIQPEHTGTYICEAVGYPATTPGARVSVYLKVEPFAEPTTRPPTACGVNEATCMNGECIPKNAVCDGDFDCSDQSDEMRCSLLGCQPNEYQCANKRCVLKNWRCDGDDDCGDNSDELYCKPSPPGSACRHDEFQCQSQNQCIPRSFHCDMELDCQDRSDEIGCSKPTILIPPPPMININIGTTIVINCTAVGVPTPEVVWRLNWGHVPSKCTMTSESGYGVLTCKDAQIIDQGAYSCEAINAKGSTFAVPDCIVVVKPSADICIDEEFNSAAVSPADCLPCFCFDHTKECSSSSLYVSQLPPPSDQFQLITLRTDTIRTSSSARLFSSRDAGSSGAANRVYLRSPNANDGIQAYRRDFNSRSEVAYFNLPPSHRGYQLLSYGGQIKYRLTYRGSGSSIRAPDVILRGNGITLYHESRIRLEPNQPVEVTVRFLPEDWTKGSDARDLARREDLMMVLQSIEYFLIRASYVESSVLDTTITNIRMDTAIEQNYNQGQAVLVEECRCPRGYIGLSCDSCAPGFVREETSSGRYLGRCLPETSQCNQAGIVNGSSTSSGCICKDLVTGPRCDQCKPNTFHLNADNQDGCINCFCMGITKTCSASTWFRQQIRTVFTTDIQGFALTDKSRRENIVERVTVNSVSREIVYRDFNRLSNEVHYWKVSSKFLGDKVTSYGGLLNYTVRHVPQPGGRSSPNNAPDVDMKGNNIRLLHYHREPVEGSRSVAISVPITEQYWQREDGRPADREHLLMVLADLDSILIKATYTTRTSEASLSEVSMDIAEERNTGQTRAYAVEQCSCPRGYKGLSCEDCDTGYTRSVQGVYLGLCEPCNCNGHSNECDPDTGVCVNCRDHTTGEECELCEAGYTGDATLGTSNDCRPDGGRPPTCSCDPRGSLRPDCADGRSCACKANCEGARCDRCREGSFGLMEQNPQGCLNCFCSGVTRECNSAKLYRSQVTVQITDNQHGFILSERNGVSVPNLRINIDQNEISYTFSSTPARSPKLYWSLPAQFTGNKVTSYGGQISITQRYDERQGAVGQRFTDSDVILTSGRTSLAFVNPNQIRPGQTVTYTVPLRETGGWRRLDTGLAVTRDDMMRVLSDLQTIEIRATYSYSMAYASLSNVVMDTAVPTSNGQEQPRDIEECRCPEGHIGTSCEQCATGFYRDRSSGLTGQCRRCPCNSNEENCVQQSDNRVVCNCRRGFSGRNCEIQDADQQRPVAPPAPASPTIVLTVTDPKIQIAEVGSTVRFRCSGQSLVGRQVLLRWGKEGDSLPAGRAQDDRRGVLIITDVRHTDSGTYVCSGQDGINVVTETVVLNVGGQSPSPPLVSVEPRYVEAQLGQSIDVRCTAQGYPTPSIQWLSAREVLVPTTDGVLKIASVRKSDEGEYTCTASNPSGTSTGRVNIFVRSEPAPQPEENPVQVVIAPTDTTARRGETIRLVCRAEVVGDRVVPVIRWTRSEGVLPVNAGQTAGVLTIPSASPSDSGIYICTVTTVSGYIRQSQARVTILAYRGPPTVRIEPDRQTISQGTSAELRCLAVGDPSPTVRWTKVGEDFSSNILVTGPILRIVNAMVSDRGMYICTAENAGGVAQTSAIVEVERREPPAVELYPQTKQTVVQGGSALFQCRVTAGIPTPRARWARVDGRPLPNNVEELDGGVIRFNRVTGSEQGQYVCTAENDAGSITGVATLTIQSIPVVTISPNANSGPIRVKEGQRVRLECRAQGDPAPSVSWRRLRTGFLFDAIDAKETQQIAVYDITRVTQSDEGTYSCTGRNDAGLTEERVQIVVEASSGRGDIEENEIEIDGSSNTGGGNIIGDDVFRVPVGGTAEMRCVLTGSQQGIYLDWVRSDGGSLPADKEIRDGILYLRNVQPDAAGVYSCIGISSQGTQIFSADRRLEVVAPPRLRLEPQRQVVRPGDQVEIRCEASGDQPITINWYKMDGVLPPAVLVNNGQLQFRGIAVSDAGRYVCAARNSVGQAEAVAEVIVNEDRVVSGTTGGQRQTDVYIGSTVELSCNLAAGTTGRIQWSRDRGLLPPTAFKTAENKLELTNVQPSDAGRYLCEVTGRQGTSSEYVLLNVKTANATCAHNEFQCKDGQCLKNSTRCNQKIDCKDKSDELNCFIGYKTRKIRGAPTLAVSLTPNKESVRRGDNLEVRCEVTGDPSALVSWRRIGGSLSRNVQVLGNLLRVTDVKPENGGVYRCQVLSTAGTFEENYVLSIQTDNEMPHNDEIAVETRTVSVQSAVVMECRTDLRQPVKYTWSRQGGILPKSARVEGSKLSIPEVRAEDAGTYVCTARNAEETMDLPTVLVVTGVVPYFAQAPLSYMQMPTLPNAYMEFDIEISFKPESPDGLILYNGQQAGGSGDFISFGLNNGYPEFRFDVGAGPAIMKSDKAIDMGKWHTVKLSRNRKNGSMTVDEDGGTFHGSATGRFLGLDLIEPLYIGGVPNIRSIHKLAGFSRGFVGCIGRLVVGSSAHELVRDATNSRGITTCETCALNPCENGGVCQEAYTQQGYTCICPSGFSGLNCDKIGETCYPGACGMGRCVNMAGGFECQCPLGKTGMNCEKEIIIYEPAFTEGSFIAYPTPPKNALRKMRMSMRIKPRQIKDSLLAYCAQTEEGQGDFSSLAIKDKRVEFRFDSGSGPAILRSDREIRAGEWVQITADRSFRDGVLFVNDGSEVRGKSPGSTRGLNLNTRLFVGGWDRQHVRLSPGVNVTSSFDGCLSQFEVQGMELDLVNSVIDSANVEDCGGASACERKPCANGGLCTETGSSLTDYTCQCEEGFSGKSCEIEADLCQVIRPCQNGGSCIGTYNAYKCNCPMGFGGSNCERNVDVAEEAFFQGDSYVEMDKALFPHASSNTAETITVEFSTLEPNGILMWHGQKPETISRGQDFVSLTVVDGRLEFSYELGSGPVQIITPVRVDDGKRHRAVARRTARDGSLELDGVILENGRSPEGPHQILNTKGNIYVGGLPNAEAMTTGRYIHGLKGCIHHLEIQESGVINFQRAALSAINVVPCSSEELKLLMEDDADDDYEPPAN